MGANLCSRVLSEWGAGGSKDGWGEGQTLLLVVVHAHIFKSGCFKGCDLHTTTDVLREATGEELCDICHVIYLAVD